jgi:hypothetical protein
MQVPFAVGFLYVVFLGYMVREWRLLQFALVCNFLSRKTIIKQQQEKVVFLGYMVREWRLLQFALVCNFLSRKTIIKQQQEKVAFLCYMIPEWCLLQFALVSESQVPFMGKRTTRKSRLPGPLGVCVASPSVHLGKWLPIKEDTYKRTTRKSRLPLLHSA